ncbi:Aromatic-L-amino-acid decarboxylase [Chionoecetes opilio]|uniref:Aromatic-L-amino-acid decarboxylase n=1 Tax=Chionoecetes opilio TaxID=41210 RepID=A0A8J4XP25_CHIOP|nr:Aromatic-L-amino-acid decarboxylase [Chionoecetes opilio]
MMSAFPGSALVCEEFRGLADGLELAHSFVFNPHKWLLVNFDCSAMWFKDSRHVVETFNVDAVLYLKPDFQDKLPDYRHWQIQFGRRFRSLKVWFVIRMYGQSGLQDHIRKQRFEGCVKTDPRFQVVIPVTLGLVTFCLKDKGNEVNEALLKRINDGGIIHMVPAKINNLYFLRFAVCSPQTEEKDVDLAWREVVTQTETLLH